MGAKEIQDKELEDIGVEITGRPEGDHELRIPESNISAYLELIKAKLTPGFWNEVVGEKEIIFIFKFKDGQIKEYKLTLENEEEIGKLCTEFCGEPLNASRNVYKFISGNGLYKDYMLEHYSEQINR